MDSLTPIFNQVARQIAESLTPAFRAMSKAIIRLDEAFYFIAAKTYREHHRRLPGSDRTSRLRKKRRKIVFDWFVDFLKHEPAA